MSTVSSVDLEKAYPIGPGSAYSHTLDVGSSAIMTVGPPGQNILNID